MFKCVSYNYVQVCLIHNKMNYWWYQKHMNGIKIIFYIILISYWICKQKNKLKLYFAWFWFHNKYTKNYIGQIFFMRFRRHLNPDRHGEAVIDCRQSGEIERTEKTKRNLEIGGGLLSLLHFARIKKKKLNIIIN